MIRFFCSFPSCLRTGKRSSCFAAVAILGVTGFACAQMPAPNPVGKPYVYKKVDGRTLSIYVLQPPDTQVSPHPVILFFHGGGWVHGGPDAFNTQAQYLASRGMVAVEVEYRLLSGAASPQICAEDAKSAIRWVREHAQELHIDPNKLVASGGSAGGYLAAFASMVPGWDDPKDDSKVSTMANLLVLFNPVIDNSPSGFGYARFGENYRRYSPYFYVSLGTPPTLILSGTDDKLIHSTVLEAYKSHLEQVGVLCQLILYQGVGHGFFNKEPYRTQTTEAMAHFLKEQGYLDTP